MGWMPRSFPSRPLACGAAAAALCLLSGVARAQDAPRLPYDLSVTGDVRLVGVDGEESWLDGGVGKLRFGAGSGDDVQIRPRAMEGTIAWQPHLSWSLSGTVVAIAQRGQEHPIDLSEAYLTFKPMPIGKLRISARAGLFWPPISLEHGGPEWAVRDTITPSAINSWIGEEVKSAGLEATASTEIAGNRLAVTVGLFGMNDTAGTLLAFRGWALHDEKATAFGHQPLPELNDTMEYIQASSTRTVIELDNRPGYYVKLVWAPPGPFELQALHYDNRGDPKAVNSALQWGWRTRFDHLGAILDLDDRTRLIAQAISGNTRMGYKQDGVIWVDTDFRSAFILATRKFGESSVSARVEAFGTRDHGSFMGRDENEDGWAVTAAARHPITPWATMLVEIVHIESRRDARQREGLSPRQAQNLAQLAFRVKI
jgi:hypothetical protein